jgi:PHD-finger
VTALDSAREHLDLEDGELNLLRLAVRTQCLSRQLALAVSADDVARCRTLMQGMLGEAAELGASGAASLARFNQVLGIKNAGQRQRSAQVLQAESEARRSQTRDALLTACIAALQTMPPGAITPKAARGGAAGAAPTAGLSPRPAAHGHGGGMSPLQNGGRVNQQQRPAGRSMHPAADRPHTTADPAKTQAPAAARDPAAPSAPPARQPAKRTSAPLKPRARAQAVVESDEELEEKDEEADAAVLKLPPRDETIDNACQVCRSTDMSDTGGMQMVLCDGFNCPHGLHLQCAKPRLTRAPKGRWLCAVCTRWQARGVPLKEVEAYGIPGLKAVFYGLTGTVPSSNNSVWLLKRLTQGPVLPTGAPSRTIHAPASPGFQPDGEDGDDDDGAQLQDLEPEGDDDVVIVEPDEDEVDDDEDEYVPANKRSKCGTSRLAQLHQLLSSSSLQALVRAAR